MNFAGTFHAEGLVWSFMIEPVSELVEQLLLLEQIVSGSCGLELESPMHPLMPAILLRISRLNSF